MEEENLEYPLAYAPIPKGSMKEEPEDGEEFEEPNEPLLAYPPLPNGVIEEEHQLENEGIQDETIVIGYIMEEPTYEEEDECSFLAYPPLPLGDVKEELEVEDGHDELSSGLQQAIIHQGEKENLLNEATDGASIIVPFVDTPALGHETDKGALRANKRKKTTKKGQRSSGTISSSNRILCSRSKERSTLTNADDGGKQLEAKKSTMVEKEECKDGEMELKDHGSIHQTCEHSSIKEIISTDEKLPFKCKTCGLAFKIEKYLKRHLARSCGIEPQFSCQECGDRFKRKGQLQQHLMRIHDVEKSKLATFGAGPKIRSDLPFKCEKCGRTYKLKISLARHLKFECELDPSFTCTLCSYRSKQKCVLRDHLMTVHNVDRSQFTALGDAAPFTRPVQPFKCEKCGKTYKQKKNLARHLKFVCGVDPSFSCTKCNYRASLKTILNSTSSTFMPATVFPIARPRNCSSSLQYLWSPITNVVRQTRIYV